MAAGNFLRASRVAAMLFLLGVAWGVWEATWLFASRFADWQAHHPWVLVALLCSGALNYGVVGLAVGLASGAAWLLLARLRRAPDAPAFVLSCLVVAAPTLVFGFWFHAAGGPLKFVPFLHPWSILGSVLILSVAALLVWGLYRLIFLRALKPGFRLRSARVALTLLLLPPLLMLLVGQARAWWSPPAPARGGPAAAPGPAGAAAPAEATPAGLPNVVLVSIETLRSDHLNAWGYRERETSTRLDRVAAEGVRFQEAFSQAPWTRPSMATLFTSLHPQQHGLTNVRTTLFSGAITLPAKLASLGYETATFCTNHNAFDPAYGFQQEYVEFPKDRPFHVSPILPEPFLIASIYNYVVTHRLKLTFPREMGNLYVDAERVNRLLLPWLDRARAPFFLHVHYFEPHAPYFEHPYRVVQYAPRTPGNRDTLLERYDGEIRFLDASLQQLIDKLDGSGSETLVVITADHGEEFHDHGDWGHGRTLFREQLHVPLIFRWPGRLEAGRVVDQPVGTIDVAPTILDLLGQEPVPQWEGRSLAPLLRGEDLPELPILAFRENPVSHDESIQLDGWKLMRRNGPEGEIRLFEVAADPGEKNDRSADRPEIVQRLGSKLDEMVRYLKSRAVPAGDRELTPAERDRLRALGYMN